jgi:hypothetical protein
MTNKESLKQDLVREDPHFRELYEKHQALKSRLSDLRQHSFPSQEVEQEEKQIKRQKLLLKDQMEEILRSHLAEHVSV